MSAFIVSKAHIDVLIAAGIEFPRRRITNGKMRWSRLTPERGVPEAADRELMYDSASEVGDMLVRECVRSVSYRYPDNGELPGPCEAYWDEPYRFQLVTAPLDPVKVLNAISCYEYQACEHPEWETSEAKAFCEVLRLHAIAALPGMEDAPWEITDTRQAWAMA